MGFNDWLQILGGLMLTIGTVGKIHSPPSIPVATPAPAAVSTPTPPPAAPNPSPAPAPTPAALVDLPLQIHAEINSYRRAGGRSDLTYSSEIAQIAQQCADKQARENRMSHDGFADRAALIGGRVTENVAQGYKDAKSVSRGWFDSPGHNQNLMDAEAKKTGLGVSIASIGTPYYCQIFN